MVILKVSELWVEMSLTAKNWCGKFIGYIILSCQFSDRNVIRQPRYWSLDFQNFEVYQILLKILSHIDAHLKNCPKSIRNRAENIKNRSKPVQRCTQNRRTIVVSWPSTWYFFVFFMNNVCVCFPRLLTSVH